MIGVYIVVAVVLFFIIVIKVVSTRRINKVKEELKNDKIEFIIQSNFLGLKSEGQTHKSHNGILAFTDKQLYFRKWWPNDKLSIKNNQIKKIEKVHKFMGKAKLKLLIKITFLNNNGKKDEAAWMIGKLDERFDIIKNNLNLK